MLSDRDRTVLREIECQLVEQDPGWVLTFDVVEARARRQHRFELIWHVVAAMCSATMAGLMIAAHAAGPALFFTAVTVVLIWLVHRLRHRVEPEATAGPANPPRRAPRTNGRLERDTSSDGPGEGQTRDET